ncbi:hypothetical protein AAY473_030281 [Plecturocebus cupreus]
MGIRRKVTFGISGIKGKTSRLVLSSCAQQAPMSACSAGTAVVCKSELLARLSACKSSCSCAQRAPDSFKVLVSLQRAPWEEAHKPADLVEENAGPGRKQSKRNAECEAQQPSTTECCGCSFLCVPATRMVFYHVGQAGLELLTSGDPPALASRVFLVLSFLIEVVKRINNRSRNIRKEVIDAKYFSVWNIRKEVIDAKYFSAWEPCPSVTPKNILSQESSLNFGKTQWEIIKKILQSPVSKHLHSSCDKTPSSHMKAVPTDNNGQTVRVTERQKGTNVQGAISGELDRTGEIQVGTLSMKMTHFMNVDELSMGRQSNGPGGKINSGEGEKGVNEKRACSSES